MQQINRNIELIRYRRFGDELLLLELANAISAAATPTGRPSLGKASKPEALTADSALAKRVGPDKTVAEQLATMPESLATLLTSLEDFILSLGDDVQRKELKLYIAYKKLKNFATVVLQRGRLLLYLHLDVD